MPLRNPTAAIAPDPWVSGRYYYPIPSGTATNAAQGNGTIRAAQTNS